MSEQQISSSATFGSLTIGDEFHCAGMRWIKTGIDRGLPLIDVEMAEESLTFESDVVVEAAPES